MSWVGVMEKGKAWVMVMVQVRDLGQVTGWGQVRDLGQVKGWGQGWGLGQGMVKAVGGVRGCRRGVERAGTQCRHRA